MLECNICEADADFGYCQEHEENNVNELVAYADALAASRGELTQSKTRIRELEEYVINMRTISKWDIPSGMALSMITERIDNALSGTEEIDEQK